MTQLLLHIGQDNLWKRVLVIAVLQLEQVVCPLLPMVHALHRRSSGAQHQQSPVLDTAVFRNISGVVPWNIF